MTDVVAVAAEPHRFGTAAQAKVRAYLIDQIRAAGLDPVVQRSPAFNGGEGGAMVGSDVQNVMTRISGAAPTKAVLLAAHYDSVPGSRGATDDSTGVAVLLETMRALRAAPPIDNDVILLFTDAEEYGVLGARAFVDSSPWARDVGAFLNFDNAGAGGPAFVTQMTEGNGRLVEVLTAAAPRVPAFSWVSALEQVSGSGTEFTEYRDLAAGLDSSSFAHRPYNHTGSETPERVDPATVQQQGDYALAVTRELGGRDLPLAAASDEAYFTIGNRVFVHYPQTVSTVLLGVLLALLAWTVAIARRTRAIRPVMTAIGLAVHLGVLVTAALTATVVWVTMQRIDGRYGQFLINGTYQLALFAVIAIAVVLALLATATRLFARRLGPANLALGALAWWIIVTVAVTFALPGASPAFIWPGLAVVAASNFLIRHRRCDTTTFIVLAISAVPVVFVVTPFLYLIHMVALGPANVTGTPTLGVTAAVLALVGGLLLAHVEFVTRPAGWWPAIAAALVVVMLAGTALATNGWTNQQPKPTFAAYVYDADARTANWKIVGSPVDAWSQQFLPGKSGKGEISLYPSMPPQAAITGPAPLVSGLPEPVVTVTSDTARGTERTVIVDINAGRPVSSLDVKLTSTQPIVHLTLDERRVTPTSPEGTGEFRVFYVAGETTTGFSLAVTVPQAAQLTFQLDQRSSGLPPIRGFAPTRRPPSITTATAFESDPTVVLKTVSVR